MNTGGANLDAVQQALRQDVSTSIGKGGCYLGGKHKCPAYQTRFDVQIFSQPTANACDMPVVSRTIQFFISDIHFLNFFLITAIDEYDNCWQPCLPVIVLQ